MGLLENEKLEDSHTSVDDKVPDSPLGGIQIFIRNLNGKSTLLMIGSLNITVDDLKAVIQDKLCITHGHQRLTLSGKLLEDSQTLANYGICQGSTLQLTYRLCGGYSPTFKIFVTDKVNPHTFWLKVESSDTIEDVIVKIEDKKGICLRQPLLFLGGEKLEADCTLAYYHIENDATLCLYYQEG